MNSRKAQIEMMLHRSSNKQNVPFWIKEPFRTVWQRIAEPLIDHVKEVS